MKEKIVLAYSGGLDTSVAVSMAYRQRIRRCSLLPEMLVKVKI